MWRCIVAMAHADGKMGKEEMDYFDKLFDNLLRFFDMPQSQRDTFAKDLYEPQDVMTLFAHINDPEQRLMLLSFAEDLAVIDGELHPGEEAILAKLRAHNASIYDRDALHADMQKFLAMRRAEHAAEVAVWRAEAKSRNPFFRLVDRVLMKMGVDVLK